MREMYLPVDKRTPDGQYRWLLEKILKKGKKIMPIQGDYAYRLIGEKMEFDMKNGFPLITERDCSKNFKGALGEHIAFLNGARTLEELKFYGCPEVFWKDWVTEEKCSDFGLLPGDLGPGSYGPSWTAVPTPYGKPFNQIDNLINQIEKMPHLRTHRIDPWIPYYTCAGNPDFPRKVVVAPCHGWINVHISREDRTFELEHQQRSADCPVGLAMNLVQYGGFGLMLQKKTGYSFDKLHYYISDAHIYQQQIRYVEEMLTGEERTLPTVRIDSSVKREKIQDFRKNDFILEDYHPHIRSFSKISTAI